jgi:hypothetical protein
MNLVHGTQAPREVEGLLHLWLADDAAAVIQRSGRTVMDLSRLLEAIESEMMQLCERSGLHNGQGLQLTVQRRSTGAVSLRWKSDRARTLSADAFAQRVSALPAEAARWYADLEARARWLNSRERLVRHARQVMRDLYAERD